MTPWVVVKFARWRRTSRGRRANRSERDTWARAKSDLLCPILAADPWGLCVVMRYARPIEEHEYEALENFIEALPYGSPHDLVNDFKYENFGVIGTKFVKVDYEVLPEPAWNEADLDPRAEPLVRRLVDGDSSGR